MMTIILLVALGLTVACTLFMVTVLLIISFQDCGIHLKENDHGILPRN